MISALVGVYMCCGLDMGTSPWPQMPPKQFDHAYHGKLTVLYGKDEQTIYKLCHNNFARACAYANGASCTVVLPSHGDPQILDALRRHEVAHCNGWRHNGAEQ